MSFRATAMILLVATAAATAVPAQTPPAARASAPAKPALPGPKGPGSLAGVWKMRGYIGSAGRSARDRVARDINGNIPPLLPEARAVLEKRLDDADKGNAFPNAAALCLPQGVPYMLFGAVEGPVQIFEEQGQVTILTEEGAEIWSAYLDKQHPPTDDIEPSFHGDSVAHWDGDTLTIDTRGLNTRTTLDQVGMPHSDAMHVITKVRRVDADTLEFLVTIDDPKTFAAPWTRRVMYKKERPGERVREYVCDNNRNLPDAQGFQSFQTK